MSNIGKTAVINNPDNEFKLEEYHHGMMGKECTIMAEFVNMNGYKIIAVEFEGGECSCFIEEMVFIECDSDWDTSLQACDFDDGIVDRD